MLLSLNMNLGVQTNTIGTIFVILSLYFVAFYQNTRVSFQQDLNFSLSCLTKLDKAEPSRHIQIWPWDYILFFELHDDTKFVYLHQNYNTEIKFWSRLLMTFFNFFFFILFWKNDMNSPTYWRDTVHKITNILLLVILTKYENW